MVPQPFLEACERTEDMNELDTQALPLLAATTGVVLCPAWS